jgi:hypothetical protein
MTSEWLSRRSNVCPECDGPWGGHWVMCSKYVPPVTIATDPAVWCGLDHGPWTGEMYQ